jgi:nucleoside-diphosphate-sugar epimerase
MLQAFYLAMERDAAVGELLVIGGGRAITTRELVDTFSTVLATPKPSIQIPYWLGAAIASSAETIFGLARMEPPLSRRTLEFFDTNNAFDISKAKEILGFNPGFSFADGLQESKTWLVSRA